jgi:hypothetical protein
LVVSQLTPKTDASRILFNDDIARAYTAFELALFNDESELINLLWLRDKVFYFILQNAQAILQQWEVLQATDEAKRAIYLEAYLKAVEHYALKSVHQFTQDVSEVAKKKAIPFNEEYYQIGALFQPDLNGDMSYKDVKRECIYPIRDLMSSLSLLSRLQFYTIFFILK